LNFFPALGVAAEILLGGYEQKIAAKNPTCQDECGWSRERPTKDNRYEIFDLRKFL
jgi:hypothetical protein